MKKGKKAGKNYKEAEVRTASPVRLVVLVCDIGIDHLKQAAALEEKDASRRDKFLEHTEKARAAILELMGALIPERSPEVASNLLALYGYFFRRITEARVEINAAPLEEVIQFWGALRDGWDELLKQGVTGSEKPEEQGTGRVVSITG